jgi:signal transduction histidine kinase
MANLVSNADRYGRDDRGALRLDVTGAVAGASLAVHVADAGPGLDGSAAARLLERDPPGTAPDGRRRDSSGMGLAVVARTLRRYGGDLEVVRVPVGTTLVVRFPAA